MHNGAMVECGGTVRGKVVSRSRIRLFLSSTKGQSGRMPGNGGVSLLALAGLLRRRAGRYRRVMSSAALTIDVFALARR